MASGTIGQPSTFSTSADGLLGVYVASYVLYTTTRATSDEPFDHFVAQSLVMPFEATMTGDGLTLYFSGGLDGTYELQRATRATTADLFSSVTQLANLTGARWPFVLPDDQVLYFISGNGGLNGTIVRAERSGDTFVESAFQPFANIPPFVAAPVVTPDELTLFFAWPDPSGGKGGFDIVRATRKSTSEPFDDFLLLKSANTPGDDFPSAVSADGCHLIFCASGYENTSAGVYVANP
jgi:hypothetical protein